MLAWLNGNDWYVQTSVDMTSGKAKVWELPNHMEDYPDYQMAWDAEEFNKLIVDLYNNGERQKAIHLYRYCHEVGTRTATHAVMDLVHN